MIVGYIRVSTAKQHPENQMDEIQRYADANGLNVDKWVVEIISGKKQIKGRKLGQLIKRMKKGDTVIVTEISRLSRSLTDIMEVMGRCIDKGVHIYTTKENYRFDDSINSKVLCFAFGLVAEIERNLISMRTKEALALKKAEGVRLGRRIGSEVKIEMIRQNEPRIRKMLEQGMSVTRMCRKIGVARSTWYKYRHLNENLNKNKGYESSIYDS